MANEITIDWGQSVSISFIIYENGIPMDITDYNVQFTCKKNNEDADADALIGPKACTKDAPLLGEGHVDLTYLETAILVGTLALSGAFYYDIKINDPVTGDVKIPIKSTFTINKRTTDGVVP